MSDYPEHDKLKEIQPESQIIGAFLDNCGYTLCDFDIEPFLTEHGEYVPVCGSIQEILAHYFSIDLDRIEAEKRAILDEMKAANA